MDVMLNVHDVQQREREEEGISDYSRQTKVSRFTRARLGS